MIMPAMKLVQSRRLVIGNSNDLDRHHRFVKEKRRVIVAIDEILVLVRRCALVRRDPGLLACATSSGTTSNASPSVPWKSSGSGVRRSLFCPKNCRWNHATWRRSRMISHSCAPIKALISGAVNLTAGLAISEVDCGSEACQYYKGFAAGTGASWVRSGGVL